MDGFGEVDDHSGVIRAGPRPHIRDEGSHGRRRLQNQDGDCKEGEEDDFWKFSWHLSHSDSITKLICQSDAEDSATGGRGAVWK